MLHRRAATYRVAAYLLGATVVFIGYRADGVTDRIVAFQRHTEAFGAVNVTDGVQAAEADLIADAYSRLLLGAMSACSGTTTPILVGGVWKAETLFGFGGEHTGRWISVDPVSGGVTSPGERGYRSLGSLRRAILLNAILDGR